MVSDGRSLRLLLEACNKTLADARAGAGWLTEMVDDLERLCGLIQEELKRQS